MVGLEVVVVGVGVVLVGLEVVVVGFGVVVVGIGVVVVGIGVGGAVVVVVVVVVVCIAVNLKIAVSSAFMTLRMSLFKPLKDIITVFLSITAGIGRVIFSLNWTITLPSLKNRGYKYN